MITQEELKTGPVLGKNTWPFIPSGTRPIHENNTPLQLNDVRDSQWVNSTMNDFVERLKEFRADLKSTTSWVLAALIALAVNFIFAALYAVPEQPNVPILVFGLALFIIFIFLAISYLPSDINVRVVWSPGSSGYLFNSKYSQQLIISLQSVQLSPVVAVATSPMLFPDEVTLYAHLICLAKLRDVIKKRKGDFVKVSSALTFGGSIKQPIVMLTINATSKFSLAIRKNQREILESEAFHLVADLATAKVQAGVCAFDYDPTSWQREGHLFLNEFLTWNVDELERTLLSQIIGKTTVST